MIAPEGAERRAGRGAEAPPEPATQEAAAEAAQRRAPRASRRLRGTAAAPPEPAAAPAPAAAAGDGDGKSFVSPVVARIASEHGVDVGQVPGTGRGGRVTKKDILGFVESGAPAAGARRPPRHAAAPAARGAGRAGAGTRARSRPGRRPQRPRCRTAEARAAASRSSR